MVKIIQHAIRDYEQFLEINEKQIIDIAPNDIVDNCITVMASLTRAFMTINGIPKIVGSDVNVLSFWTTFWKKPSSTIEFIDNVESKKELDASVANYIFGICREAIQVTISFMKDQVEKDRIFQLSYENLTNQDCKIIDNCRTYWINGNYYSMGEEISDYLEKKIRQNIYNIFKLFYGNEKCRTRRYSKEIIKAIESKKENDQKRGMGEIQNELQFLDRKEYKILMTKNTQENYSELGEVNWKDVFKIIFTSWDQEKLLKFLDKFGDINISVAHNKTQSIGKQNQPDMRDYVMNAIEVIQKLNSAYGVIHRKGVQLINSKYYFGFKNTLDTLCMEDVAPKIERTKHVVNTLKKMEQIDVNMEDPDYLESLYNTDYREFALIIHWLLNATPEEQAQIGSKLVVVKDESPNFIFRFDEKIDQIL